MKILKSTAKFIGGVTAWALLVLAIAISCSSCAKRTDRDDNDIVVDHSIIAEYWGGNWAYCEDTDAPIEIDERTKSCIQLWHNVRDCNNYNGMYEFYYNEADELVSWVQLGD